MKNILLCCALLGMFVQTAVAAPAGWYTLQQAWRDGSFTGSFYYDGSQAEPIVDITGTLVTLAQSSTITSVWTGEKPPGATWSYITNGAPGELEQYDAGFFLHLVDAGQALTLDMAADNGLYDWSADYAYFWPEQLNGSPLLSYAIDAVSPVPEPSTVLLLGAGLLVCVRACRKRRCAQRLS